MDDSRKLQLATIEKSGDHQLIESGPGMQMNIFFTTIGCYVDVAVCKGAKLFRRGPACAAEAIEKYFGDGRMRVAKLDQLFALVESPSPAHDKLSAQAVSDLKKLCSKIIKYTERCAMMCTVCMLI